MLTCDTEASVSAAHARPLMGALCPADWFGKHRHVNTVVNMSIQEREREREREREKQRESVCVCESEL